MANTVLKAATIAGAIVGIVALFSRSVTQRSEGTVTTYSGIRFGSFPRLRQDDDWGCWAACVSGICHYYRVRVDERTLMELSSRQGGDSGHAIQECLKGIEQDHPRFKPDATLVTTWRDVLPCLLVAFRREEPVILGLRERGRIPHAVVARGADLDGQGNVVCVHTADPGRTPYWQHPPTPDQLANSVAEAVFVSDPTK